MKLPLLIAAAAIGLASASVYAGSDKKHDGHGHDHGHHHSDHGSMSSAAKDRSKSDDKDRTTDGPVDQGRNATGADEIQTPYNDGTSGADETRGSGTKDH